MIPLRSNTNKENCSPISSNCVIWQGPNISCIGLCNGDSVSDVVYKTATLVCELQTTLDLSDLDLKCLVDNCLTCPDPEKTLGIVLQLLINKVCTLQEIIDSIGGGNSTEVEVRLAQCFIADFTDSNGDVTNPVPVSQYVQKIAQKICDILSRLDSIDLTTAGLDHDIQALTGRVVTLENASDVQVVPVCTGTAIATDIDVAVRHLEEKFCTLQSITGIPTALALVLDEECQAVTPPGYVESLATPGTALWQPKDASTTIADTLMKMWAAICDVRAAVSLIQDTCCQISCDDLKVDFDVTLTADNGVYFLNFFLGQKTVIPTTFTDCDATNGQKLTITDGAGHEWTAYLPVRTILNDIGYVQNGYPIQLGANLDPTKGLMIDTNICITNGTLNCVKCLHKDIPYIAPICDYCEVTATDTVTIIYKVCTTSTSTSTPN